MIRAFTLAIAAIVVTPVLYADALEFDFKDPKGVNSINFLLDSDLEPISGVAGDISGKVMFDPKKPKATRGTIVAQAKSVYVPNSGMKRKLETPEWLEVEKHPEVKFTVEKVKSTKKAKKSDGLEMIVVGTFEMRGVKKSMTVPVLVTYLEGKAEKRTHGSVKGDLLALRAKFSIKRSDFKLGPPMPLVADEIQIDMSIIGTHAKS